MQSARWHHSHSVDAKVFCVAAIEIGNKGFEPSAVIGGFAACSIAPEDFPQMSVNGRAEEDLDKAGFLLLNGFHRLIEQSKTAPSARHSAR